MPCDVLVLDDDPLVLMTMAELLRDEGFEVEQAANSGEAIRLFQQEPSPRVLVTDLNLGERKTGADVARELRRGAPELPVVFVTGRPDLLADHVMDHRQRLLRKPVPVEKLAAVIRELRSAVRGDEIRPGTAGAAAGPEVVPLYRSGSGDTWTLIHDRGAGTAVVRHVANAASGGTATEIPVAAFLAPGRSGPEHQAARDWVERTGFASGRRR